MGFFTKDIKTLNDLFVHTLQDIYYAEQQILEQVFQMHGVQAKGIDCPAIDGILKEASDVAGEVDDKDVLDAALIAAAQAVEHYEIARYGALIAWAKMLGRGDCASVLQQNLDEEKLTNDKLNTLALRNVNKKAA